MPLLYFFLRFKNTRGAMIQNFINAVRGADVEMVSHLLSKNPKLAKASIEQKDPESPPVFALTFRDGGDEGTNRKLSEIRQKLLSAGANINHQFPDGSTLGHSFASNALRTNAFPSYKALISWIQSGGNSSLKDSVGDAPVQLITKVAAYMFDLGKSMNDFPGFQCTSALLLGLDKRNFFPQRALENGMCDNPDELKELRSKNPRLFYRLQNQNPDLKFAYKYDTVAYRALRELLIENGADINVEVAKELGGGTLGHQFALEAANRDQQRYYLRLIRWMRDGGDLNKKDELGLTVLEKLAAYAQMEKGRAPLPGLVQTLAILEGVQPDRLDDPASQTDSRTPMYNPYPRNKIDRQPVLDTHEGMETTLRAIYKKKIADFLPDQGIVLAEVATRAPLVVKATLHANFSISEIDEQVINFCQQSEALEPNSQLEKPLTYKPDPVEQQQLPRRRSLAKIEDLTQQQSLLGEEIKALKEQLAASEREHKLVKAEIQAKSAQTIRQMEVDLRNKQEKVDQNNNEMVSLRKLFDDFDEALICPITQELLEDPVVSPYGHTFERQAITEWLGKTPRCPMTNKSLKIEDLNVNYALKHLLAMRKKQMNP